MPYIGNVTTSSNVNGSQINNGTITGDKLSLPFNYDSATLYLDDTNNRVGILTASPTSTLTVGTGGVVSIPLASATTPSLVFGTDTNTGIYSPGADQVAISTNSSQRLAIDASGNVSINSNTLYVDATNNRVGVGTAVPSTVFHVNVASGNNGLRVSNTGNSASDFAVFDLVQNSGQKFVVYTNQENTTANANSGAFILQTGAAERLRITAAGLVGIGTSAPSANLHVAGTAIKVDGSSTATVNLNGSAYGMVSAGADLYLETAGAGNQVIFRRGGTEFARFDASGRLGIGTTSPSAPLAFADTAGTAGDPSKIALFSAVGIPLYGFGVSANQLDYVTGGSHVFYSRTGSVSSEKARLTSDGKFLVGTSTARANFFNTTITSLSQVESSGEGLATASFTHNANSTTGAAVVLAKTRGTAVGSTTIVQNGDGIGSIYFQGSDGTEFVEAATIQCLVDGTPGTNDMPGRLVFSVTQDGSASPTGRMRISNDGNHFFYSDGGGVLTLGSSKASGTTDFLLIGTSGATGFNTGTNRFFVFTNGNVQNSNNSYGAISDIKLKESIVDANSQWDDLKALQVRNYNFKSETGYDTHTQIGLIAQEVELVSPGLVSETPDRDAEGNDLGTVTKSVNYSVLYMKAVKALQEAMERIETLEAKVAALEGV
jgi:hypothetical protein